jgi:exopolysaccharide biosynthesis polyprenyl glycosylphosphotransferase
MQDLPSRSASHFPLPDQQSGASWRRSAANSRPGGGTRLALIALDLLLLFLVFSAVLSFRFGNETPSLTTADGLALAGLAFANWLGLALFGVDQIDVDSPSISTPVRTILAFASATALFVFVVYLSGAVEFTGVLGRGVLLGTQLLAALISATARGLLHRRSRSLARRAKWLVLSSDSAWPEFQASLKSSGFLGEILRADQQSDGRLKVDTSSNWAGCLIVGALDTKLLPAHDLMQLRFNGVRVFDLVQFSETIWKRIPLTALEDRFFILSDGFSLLHQPFRLRLKRWFDVALALALLIFAAPLVLVAAIAIRLESPGPVLFRQTRVGERGKHFTIFKLRSMRLDAEADGTAQWSQKDDPRVLRSGRFLRASRIDELPQLVNVLQGDMSFIGPRPERPEFTSRLEEQIPFYNLRHLLKPGLTGWAQVLYPYGASVEDAKKKLEYDLYYIKNQSLWLDLAILIRTVRVVLLGRGR